MKGNLSKKKGFLGDVLGNDEIKSISDTLEARIDKRIANAEGDIGGIKENIPILKKELETYTDEMVYEAYKGIENLEKATKGKEDVSNKVMAVDDDGRYYSGEITEMRIYQVIDEHIVQDLNVPKEDRIPSVKAVSEAIKGIKPEIDLSVYYKKDEIDAKDEKLQQDIYDLQADIVGREEKSNKAIGGNMPITLAYKENTGLANDENYPSLKYLAECFEYFRGEIGGSGGSVDLSNYFTKEEINNMDLASKLWVSDQIDMRLDNYYNKMKINEMIGNIETALENIIEKYGLGGDAS